MALFRVSLSSTPRQRLDALLCLKAQHWARLPDPLWPDLTIAAMLVLGLHIQIGEGSHMKARPLQLTYQTTANVINRQPGGAHVPSVQARRNNPSIRWAHDATVHYTSPWASRPPLVKQWAFWSSRLNANFALGFIHWSDKWSQSLKIWSGCKKKDIKKKEEGHYSHRYANSALTEPI